MSTATRSRCVKRLLGLPVRRYRPGAHGRQPGRHADDFGIAFREAVLRPRVFVFLAIGVVIFLLITFWPLVRPYIRRPGMSPVPAPACW